MSNQKIYTKSEAHNFVRELASFYDQQSDQTLLDHLHLLLDDKSWIELAILKSWQKKLQNQSVSSFVVCYFDIVRPYMKGDQIHIQNASFLRCYQLMLQELVSQEKSQAYRSPEPILTMIQQLIGDIFSLTRNRGESSRDLSPDLRSIVLSSQLKMCALFLEGYNIDQETLTGITALFLSFSHPRLSSHILLPSLEQINVLEYCTIPTTPSLTCMVAFEPVELSRILWWDGMTNSAFLSCWESLALRLNLNFETVDDTSKEVCKSLGWGAVAKAIRAQFFKKQEIQVDSMSKHASPPSYPLNFEKEPQREPLYKMEEYRIHAALHFVNILGSEVKHVVPELLPICLALIDSFPPTLVALGSKVLMVLLDTSPKNLFLDFEDTIVSVLKKTLKTTDDRIALGYVCLSCTKLVEAFPHRNKDRRHFTITLIQIAQGKMFRQSEEIIALLGIMLGGLGPLLKQQAELKNVESVEIARPALRVLLPLLRWDFDESGKKLQIISLVTLINLMAAAYPIMPHHSCKIMCELLACWGHSHRSLSDCKRNNRELCLTVLSLSTHAAAVALVFCGKRALEITKISNFDPDMTGHILRVEEQYQVLLAEIKQIL